MHPLPIIMTRQPYAASVAYTFTKPSVSPVNILSSTLLHARLFTAEGLGEPSFAPLPSMLLPTMRVGQVALLTNKATHFHDEHGAMLPATPFLRQPAFWFPVAAPPNAA